MRAPAPKAGAPPSSAKGTSMKRSSPVSLLTGAAPVPLAVLAFAGCGGGSGAAAASTPPKTADGQAPTVGVAATGLGKTLVDSRGRTLYLFKKDSGTKSACIGECAKEWPPLRSNGTPTAGGGAGASMVSTTQRSDGRPQVTYNGH